MKNKAVLYLVMIALVAAISVLANACGKSDGNGVGGKVIITGSGST